MKREERAVDSLIARGLLGKNTNERREANEDIGLR